MFHEAKLLVDRYAAPLPYNVTKHNFIHLSEALLASLAIYNGRRASEVSGTPFESFRSRPTEEALQRELHVVPLLDRADGVQPADLSDYSRCPEEQEASGNHSTPLAFPQQ